MTGQIASVAELTPRTLLRGGANGLRFADDGTLWVAQAMAGRLSAVGPAGKLLYEVASSSLLGPDDLAFDSRGRMFVTDVMAGRVLGCATGDDLRPIATDVPGANGITIHGDRIFISEYRPDGRILEVFVDGSAPRVIASGLMMPNALCLGPDQRLYFPLVPLGEVWRVELDGSGLERVAGDLQRPIALKFDPQGHLIVPQSASGAITRFDLATFKPSELGCVAPFIDNLAFAPDGRLFVSRFIDGGIDEITDSGVRCFISGGLVSPCGLSVDASGALLIANGMSLCRIDSYGGFTRIASRLDPGFPGYIRGVATAADGSLRMTNSAGELAHFLPGEQSVILAEQLDQPIGVAVAVDGSSLVCEAGAGVVTCIAPDGTRTTVARGLSRPTGLHMLQDGSLLVSEADAGRVIHIDGADITVLATGLDQPHGVTAVSSTAYALDRGARSLLRLSMRGDAAVPVAVDLPVGEDGPMSKDGLPGIPGLLPGPLCPFTDIVALPDGGVAISGDAAGTIVKVGPSPATRNPDRN